jgi:hypothetical protein
VEAEIDCGVVSIRGRVSGQVHGRQRIELLAGCRVEATLVTPKLVIEDGAFFHGDCRMGEPPEAAPGPPGRGEPFLKRPYIPGRSVSPAVARARSGGLRLRGRPWYPATLFAAGAPGPSVRR